MPLTKAVIKDLKSQIPAYTEEDLPTIERRHEFIDSQIEATKSIVYRTLVDLEIAEKFANAKDDASNETAKQRFAEGSGALKAYLPSLEVLRKVKSELPAQK